MKTIVTHLSPDADAITAVWLLKRFHKGWEDADVAFVPAGKTWKNDIVDSDPDIWHVDTGLGKLDHHQTDEDTCAARRVLEFLSDYPEEKKKTFPDEALIRLVDVINDLDHFRESQYPNASADFYNVGFVSILDGWRLMYSEDHERVVRQGMEILDGVYRSFQNKVWAEHEIKEHAQIFSTIWGDGLAVETVNDEVLRIAQLQGHVVVVRKDPKKGFVRIKALPNSLADLSGVYKLLKHKDNNASWYLHASKRMILNGSSKNPESKSTSLNLNEVIDILRTYTDDHE